MTVRTIQSSVARQPSRLSALSVIEQESPTGTWQWISSEMHGCLATASVGNTLTEVINITGSGVFTQLGLIRHTDGTASPATIKVVVDGVTLVNATAENVNDPENYWSVVGHLAAAGGSAIDLATNRADGFLPFYNNITVSIQGDAFDDVLALYDYYLT